VGRYPDIADHGLIGDLQTAALVTTDGVVDWFCAPRFDSPSVFASLLDADRGGYFKIAPDSGDYVSRQLYLPDTAILITRFMTPDGVAELHDFMPVITGRATPRHRLIRHLRAVRGTMRFAVGIQPAFDYARQEHTTELSGDGAVFRSAALRLTLRTTGGVALRQQDGGVQAAGVLNEGGTWAAILESDGGPVTQLTSDDVHREMQAAMRFWRGWLDTATYHGRWQNMVTRSAITLKLLTYAPTGGPVAAPTTSLPEQVGGERNWDYRYTWIRDGSFSVYALLGLGFREEAAAFSGWLRNRAKERAGGVSGPLKIMYRVDGTSGLSEQTLDHFEGWRGSRPVRIGNGACDQLQLDIYGELMDAMFLSDRRGVQLTHGDWTQLASFMDWLCEHWDQPDEGIWETRGGQQNFTYGRFQSWIALDRAIRLAAIRGWPGGADQWSRERDRIYRQIFSQGWNERAGAFTQYYGSDVLDSSLLLMPLQGFISPTDPAWLSTLRAIDRTLVSDSLVYRYNPSASPDGLAGDEGTFSLCTFWYVDALARAGRLDEARLIFEKMHTYANHLGLYSEEISRTGQQLGNFPQAFSHLALISAAVNLDHQIDHGAGSLP
jgi:GH15 family glucan-1,4-alpha-glucosidase